MPKKFILFENKIGFDNAEYARLESNAIIQRASRFQKFYLEIGGKLIQDYHAARVLPGYQLDTKMGIIRKLARKRSLEFLLCISARDLQSGKKTGALGISYGDFSLRMIKTIEKAGYGKPKIVINLFSGEQRAKSFGFMTKRNGYSIYYRGLIKNYPKSLGEIISKR
ncbi:MAG: DUF1846 family protein, partial [Candidatus ainarchaeum sp.]|nr:DUF1846 family protein [Candidatus ainarchaeum sp.]